MLMAGNSKAEKILSSSLFSVAERNNDVRVLGQRDMFSTYTFCNSHQSS